MSQPPTVHVVDDELSIRKALDRLLRAAGFKVATYASAEEFLQAHDPDLPGCLVLDMAMPGCSGLELQQALAARGKPPPIIFLTGRAEVGSTVQALQRGADDFLTKPVEDALLISAIRKAIEKDSTERAERAELDEIRSRLATLTPRELEVLHCVVVGKPNKQTAAELGTVEKTIKVHRSRVMAKMQVQSLAELVLLAARIGLVSAGHPHPFAPRH